MPVSPLSIVTVLFQGFLLLVTGIVLLVFFKDIRALFRKTRTRREKFERLLSLGTIWKPK